MKQAKFILFILFVFCFSDLHSQNVFYETLKSMNKNLKYDIAIKNFIPVDSFDISNLKIKISEKEIKKCFSSKGYYLVKVGDYIEDSAFYNQAMEVFNKIKQNLQKQNSGNFVKIDANCQNYLSIYSDAKKCEEIFNTHMRNSIYIEISKSKKPIYRLSRRRDCYL
ncbi:hypothetical protein [Ferruginibacter profundus]